jgi:hypothetical protein
MRLPLPWKLVAIHTVLILLFTFTLWNKWFLSDIPFDCFYLPFFLTSGPVVHTFAHFLQHYSEQFFPAHTHWFLPWGVVPAFVCLILGGIQWWYVGRLWLWFRKRRSSHIAHGAQQV